MRIASLRTAFVLTLAGLAAAAIGFPADATSASANPHHDAPVLSEAAAGANAWAGSVIIVNPSWNRVNVEVRKGKSDDVNQLAVVKTGAMSKNEKWPIPCSSDEGYVWWRRDADPDHQNGQWTGWTKKACFGKDEEVKL